MNPRLPRTVRLVAWLVHRTVPADAARALLGDLFEELDEHRRPARFVRDATSIVFHIGVRSLCASVHPATQRKASVMESLLLDVRFALRSLRKRPGFAAVVLVKLALGIGASTAIFSVVNTVLLRPLPYAKPEQLTRICQSSGCFWIRNCL